MKNCIDMNHMVLSISKLKLGEKLELILMRNGINYLTDLSSATESSLIKLPGIGYAYTRKILRAYRAYIKRDVKPNETISHAHKKNVVKLDHQTGIPMHPVLEKSNLSSQDKKIINLVIRGYSQQQISAFSGLSKRTLRYRLAMLKLEYQAKTVTQLVCHIFDGVLLLTE